MSDRTLGRRAFVRAAGVATLGALAGCGARSSPATLRLSVVAHTEIPYTVELTLFEAGGNGTRSEARVYDTSIDVPAGGEPVSREAVAEAQRYVIRYSAYAENSRLTDQSHIHYYPTGEDDSVVLDIDENGRVSYRG